MSAPDPPPTLELKLRELPDGPGVYTFRGRGGRVLYVGKAKSLRRRVGSYFGSRAGVPDRIRRLVAEIQDVDWLVTDNEIEALVLENSLIKKNKPRYNVNLRDDKSFPHVRLTTSDRWPRMDIVRRPRRDGDAYFGPFVPASTARKTMRLLAQHFGIRSCRGPIEQQDHRACLYYQVDQCLAPCAAECTEAEYAEAVQDALSFLKGQTGPLRERVATRMRAAADKQAYERAAHHRDLLRMLDDLRQPQRMASTGLEEADVWGLHGEGDRALLVVSAVREGQVRGSRELVVRDAGGRDDRELLGDAVRLYYHDAGHVPAEILLPTEIDEPRLTQEWLRRVAGRAVRLHRPHRGAKAERVRWAGQNARAAFELKLARGEAAREGLLELADLLDLPEPPERIDGFDVSNIQGSDVVASMVVFTGGEPDRAQYRTFALQAGEGGPDDFASMREVLRRRYRRALTEGDELPGLVLVDGGPGQLGAAAAVLDELALREVPLAALAKREELLHPRGRRPLRLPRRSPALQLVQRIRDEAHRVAVGFHRRRRRARTVTSALDRVPGIGPARRKALLRRFGSVEAVRAAALDELADVLGPKLARTVKLHLAG